MKMLQVGHWSQLLFGAPECLFALGQSLVHWINLLASWAGRTGEESSSESN